MQQALCFLAVNQLGEGCFVRVEYRDCNTFCKYESLEWV